MKKFCSKNHPPALRCLAACFLILACAGYSAAADSPRTRLSINDDWRFTRGDPPDTGTNIQYLDFMARDALQPIHDEMGDIDADSIAEDLPADDSDATAGTKSLVGEDLGE